jgi:hypothetical protein
MQALERAMRELVLGPELGPEGSATIDAWLERNRVPSEDAAEIRAEWSRLTIYRELVRGRLRDAVLLAVPRMAARLGPLFDELFERYLAERGPRSHYLRDVTTEFLDFAEPLAAADARVPPWAMELGRHEALDVLIGSLEEAREPKALGELDPDRGLEFSETARVVRYEFTVHRLSADTNDRSAPERSPTALFVYRSATGDVRYLETTPLAAAILERLLAGETLRLALEGAAQSVGVPLDATALEGTAALLSDLAGRGAVLGAKAADLQKPPKTAETSQKDA